MINVSLIIIKYRNNTKSDWIIVLNQLYQTFDQSDTFNITEAERGKQRTKIFSVN